MDDKSTSVITGILMDEESTVSFIEICQQYHLNEESLIEMMEQGLFKSTSKSIKKEKFDYPTRRRIETASRLQKDLELNLPGVVLVMELLEELEQARNELRIMQRHFNTP